MGPLASTGCFIARCCVRICDTGSFCNTFRNPRRNAHERADCGDASAVADIGRHPITHAHTERNFGAQLNAIT